MFLRVVKGFLVVLVVGVLVWFLPKLDAQAISKSVRTADPLFVISAVLLAVLAWSTRSLMLWRILLLRLTEGFSRVWCVQWVGALFDAFIPGRSGLFARWGLLSLQHRKSKGFIFSALAFGLILEGVALLTLFALALGMSAEVRDLSGGLAGWIVLAVLTVLLFLLRFAKSFEGMVGRLPLGKTTTVLSFFEILKGVRHPARLFPWIGIAFLNWCIQTIGLLALSQAFGLSLQVFQAVLLLVAINLAILVPIVPGHVGTIQLVVTAVLAKFGVPHESALAFSIVYHAVQLFPVVILGGMFSFLFRVDLTKSKSLESRDGDRAN